MADESLVAILRQGVEQWNEWRSTHLRGAVNFRGVELSGKDLRTADLRDVDLSAAAIHGANLKGADLRGADLSGADLGAAALHGASLRGADLSGADLSGAGLGDADLCGAYLTKANLGYANLSDAILCDADVAWASLKAARLRRTNLTRTNFSWANLSGAMFIGANLTEANLTGADLTETNLNGANLSRVATARTIFAGLDLRQTIGLDTARHYGPSIIGVDTIYRSNGRIPEVFLRGAGVPESLIVNMKSLVEAMDPIQFYSCFISYSSKDQEFAERLHADLQAKGVRCWFAPHHIAGGKKIQDQIDEAIRLHERLLLILSPASMESEWVKTEISKARKRERNEKRRVLFPVTLVAYEELRDWECFDADIGKDSAREIREYFIPDFSRWKDHDSYRQAFERLLRDLKAESQQP